MLRTNFWRQERWPPAPESLSQLSTVDLLRIFRAATAPDVRKMRRRTAVTRGGDMVVATGVLLWTRGGSSLEELWNACVLHKTIHWRKQRRELYRFQLVPTPSVI
jgi:hypothetical protein